MTEGGGTLSTLHSVRRTARSRRAQSARRCGPMFVTSVFRSSDFFTAVAWNAATPSRNSNVSEVGGTEVSLTDAPGTVLLLSASCCEAGSNFTDDAVSGSTASVFIFVTFSAILSAFTESAWMTHTKNGLMADYLKC